MEDAVGSPASKQRTFPGTVRKSESRHLIVEVEIQHLWLVDGQIRLLTLGRLGGILNECGRGVSRLVAVGRIRRSQILRQGVTEAARQPVADTLGDLDLKRVVPGITVALVLVTDVSKLREWP